MNKQIFLASASPRRAEILTKMGINDFKIIPSDINESILQCSPSEFVQKLAKDKALNVSENNQGIIISADTVVVLDGKILGKPEDEINAKVMLKNLSGKVHSVFTGVCVINTFSGKTICDYEKTDVYFRETSDAEIEEYIKTEEPMDKAGAYGIQGRACKFITRIEGCYYNVVGLPAAKLFEMLKSVE